MTTAPEQIAEGVRLLRAGEIVAFPTETVYGLGADALNAAAVEKVFELKGRPRRNPLIVHVSGEGMARSLAPGWSGDEDRLARAFWPGSLTIVTPSAPQVPGCVRADGPTVALRCPEHPITLSLIEAFGGPIVGPSANRSGEVSPTIADHVRASFPDLFILDGGPCRGGIESTVVRVLDDRVQILRPGLITPREIAGALGKPVEAAPESGEDDPLLAPGRMARHYAPRTPARLMDRAGIEAMRGPRVIVLAISPIPSVPAREVITLPGDARSYAAMLYAALREADARGADVIAIERPPTQRGGPEASLWVAILDRLTRATG